MSGEPEILAWTAMGMRKRGIGAYVDLRDYDRLRTVLALATKHLRAYAKPNDDMSQSVIMQADEVLNRQASPTPESLVKP